MQNQTLQPVKLLQGVLLIIKAAEFRSFRETGTRGLGSVIDVGATEDCPFWGQLRSVVLQLNYRTLCNQDGRHWGRDETPGVGKRNKAKRHIRRRYRSGNEFQPGCHKNMKVLSIWVKHPSVLTFDYNILFQSSTSWLPAKNTFWICEAEMLSLRGEDSRQETRWSARILPSYRTPRHPWGLGCASLSECLQAP